jgi:hypothetical protein
MELVKDCFVCDGNDPNPDMPIWTIDQHVRNTELTRPSASELHELK